MNRQETRCTGTKDGKRCSKLISKEASFCSDCESSNTDNVTAQSLCESDIQSTGESDSSESHGDDNGNEKWDFHEQLNASEVSGVHHKVNVQCGGPENVLPPNESVITLTSMGFTREQAIDALKKTGGRIEKAVDWLLTLPTDEDIMSRTERALYEVNLPCEEQSSVIPSNELVRKLTSVGFTEEQAIGALKCTNGNEEEEAANLLLSSVKDYDMEQMKAAITEGEILSIDKHLDTK
ncbi:UBP14 [Mytilus edulis]|uniref:USP5_13 n=1 Tax=Mytilus edulis TaxID=6550 RepID=A0A8S3T5S1_MYTED|nr:UBP14 [Mytilus edulis]